MRSKQITLVLGSGGARGLAHVGVIRCLCDHGFDIRYISGCSIGALVGGIYAAGKLDTYADWVCALTRRDIVRLLDWSFSGHSIFKGERIIEELKALIGDVAIEDLPLGFTAVATELNEQREVWLNRGSLWHAIRASIAVPLVFAPVERDGRLLVDGGLVNPVPIAPVFNSPVPTTVAVDLNGQARRGHSAETRRADGNAGDKAAARSWMRSRISAFIDELIREPVESGQQAPSVLELALRSMEVMQTTISRMKLAAYSPQIVVEVPRNLATFFEFHRAEELIDFGYARTRDVLAQRSD
jgi:NTE family protein